MTETRRLKRSMNRVLAIVLIVGSVGYGFLQAASEDIVVVKERHESWLMSLPGVVGTGIGDCEGSPCIKVYVKERTPELERQVPKQLGGFALDIEVTGPIDTLSK